MYLVKQHIISLTPENELSEITKKIEHAARTCYQSMDKITSDSADKFVAMLIKNGHEAMLEHASLSLKLVTDRATANALVRHRHCAFAQESTHFIDYIKVDDLTFIEQVGIKDKENYQNTLMNIERLYFAMKDEDRKVRRSILPLTLKTELVITTNMREWRNILKVRMIKKAHPQMQELMKEVYSFFIRNGLSIFVSDIEEL